MRVTDKSIANNSLNSMQLNLERLVKLQQQASSGLKINAPGDDPVGAQKVLQVKGALQDNEQFARNIVTGTAWLGQADNAMSAMGDVVTRAHELAMGMANGTYNANDRVTAVNEVKQLTDQLVQLGNTLVGGKYIFGGFKNDSAPFNANGTFVGSDDAVSIALSANATVVMNYSGGKLLNGTGGGVDIFGELQKLSAALSTNNTSGIQGTLSNLDVASSQITAARSDIGSRMNRIENVSSNMASMNIDLEKSLSNTQDIDILKVYSDLANQQTAYQAALSTTAKISQLSLLNYLK
jgi:flagellar hook-associated protein 3 FlgL